MDASESVTCLLRLVDSRQGAGDDRRRVLLYVLAAAAGVILSSGPLPRVAERGARAPARGAHAARLKRRGVGLEATHTPAGAKAAPTFTLSISASDKPLRETWPSRSTCFDSKPRFLSF